MDVKCEKCGTEYEFDDRKVADSGITVKCTNCGHLFRVVRSAPAFAFAAERDEPSFEVPRPPRTRWMIRNGSGQIREFKDLATLHQWIAHGKVSQSDEISKTGENWKPLSAIVELAALFTQTGLRAIPRSAPPGQPPPMANASTLSGIAGVVSVARASEASGIRAPSGGPAAGAHRMGSGEQRTPATGPGSTVLGMRVAPPPLNLGLPPPIPRSAEPSFGGQGFGAPPRRVSEPERQPERFEPSQPGIRPPEPRLTVNSVSARLPDQFEPSMGSMAGPLPAPAQLQTMGFGGGPGQATGPTGLPFGIPPPMADARSTGMHGAIGGGPPLVRGTGMHPSVTGEMGNLGFAFEGEQPPGLRSGRAAGGGAKGFAMGMLASVAIAGVGYFVYDMFMRRQPQSSATVARGVGGIDSTLLVRLDRAEDRQASDGTEGIAEADRLAEQVLTALGDPPAEPRLAARARLVLARSGIARAEYARLEGQPADLGTAERLLAEARAEAPDDPRVELAYADLRRVQGDLSGARAAIARARDLGAPEGPLQFLAAVLPFHTRTDPGALADRLAALPPTVLDLPRARYLTAVAQQRAGRLPAAEATLRQLLNERRDHAPAQRLLASIQQVRDLAGNSPTAPASGSPSVAGVAALTAPAGPASAVVPPAAPATAGPVVVATVVAIPEKAPAPKDAPRAIPPSVPEPAAAAPAPTASAPASFDNLVRRGQQLLEAGRTGDARRLFIQASERNPRSPEVWANLGWCDLDDGRHDGAVRNFKAALERSDRYADAIYGLGMAYAAAGRAPEARKAYERFLEHYPTGSKASMVRRKLEALK